MNMFSEKKWYAVFTKPKWEKKVASLLERAGMEHYCPTTKVCRQWSDRKKIVIEPLFKSYVFVRVCEKEKWMVTDLMGVINYVYFLGKPAIIKSSEIESIQKFLSKHDFVNIESNSLVPGDLVKIKEGAFKDMEAEIASQKGQKVLLNIPSLGLALVATDIVNTSLLKKKDHRQNAS